MRLKILLAATLSLTSIACIDETEMLSSVNSRLANGPIIDTDPGECLKLIELSDGGPLPAGIVCIGSEQGRELLGQNGGATAAGKLAPIVRVASAAWWSESTTPHPLIDSVTVDGLGLNVQSGGQRLSNAQLRDLTFSQSMPAPATNLLVRIADVMPEDAKGRGRYVLQYKTAAQPWIQLCPDNDFAYVVAGTMILSNGDYARVPTDRASFACRNSATAKAIRLGYAPDNSHHAEFNATTTMIRADYCGLGEPHTIDGTPIVAYDLAGLAGNAIDDDMAPPLPPMDNLPFKFEAAWRSTTKIKHNEAEALCLSKLRWQSLPPGGYCPQVLLDPRLNEKLSKFCDDLGLKNTTSFHGFLQNLAAHGALVFSSSRFNEVGLWIWWNGDRSDYMTTTKGFWGGASEGTKPPLPGYFSGVKNAAIANEPFVARVFTDPGPNRVPLQLWHNETRGGYRTTTNRMGLMGYCPPFQWCDTWVMKEIVGYVYLNANDVPAPLVPVALRNWYTSSDDVLARDGVTLPAPWNRASEIDGYGFTF